MRYRLAASVQRIGVQRIRIGIIHSLLAAQVHCSFVSVGIVLGARTVDLWSVCVLVKNSRSLVLSMALTTDRIEIRVEDVAVADVVLRRQGVAENSLVTVTILIYKSQCETVRAASNNIPPQEVSVPPLFVEAHSLATAAKRAETVLATEREVDLKYSRS